VLPDGCADVLVALEGHEVAAALAVGPMTRPQAVSPARQLRWVAVRFRPGTARGALGLPLDRLRDGRVRLSELWPEADVLAARVASAARLSPQGAARALAQGLAARLERAAAPDPLVAAATEQLVRGTSASIAVLSRRLGVSRQHLARRFREEVGHGPKLLARVLRLRRALALLQDPESRPLALVALEAGYYDQPHMNLDLRALAGATARQLRRGGGEGPSIPGS
jgi:AraC-like DNA-binding protein